jgi:hypothetical protein
MQVPARDVWSKLSSYCLAAFTIVSAGRWAMLGTAGALAVELLGYGNWYDAPLWVS